MKDPLKPLELDLDKGWEPRGDDRPKASRGGQSESPRDAEDGPAAASQSGATQPPPEPGSASPDSAAPGSPESDRTEGDDAFKIDTVRPPPGGGDAYSTETILRAVPPEVLAAAGRRKRPPKAPRPQKAPDPTVTFEEEAVPVAVHSEEEAYDVETQLFRPKSGNAAPLSTTPPNSPLLTPDLRLFRTGQTILEKALAVNPFARRRLLQEPMFWVALVALAAAVVLLLSVRH